MFFTADQARTVVAGETWDVVSTEGYEFKLSMDKLFTGGGTEPTGRYLRVFWPDGLEAQAVTAGPVTSGARVDIKRADGQPFAISSLTFKILASTAGAGGALEIMPMLNGEDGRTDPYAYIATGYAGQSFSHSTPELAGFDGYKLTLYVDFALTSLALVDESLPRPCLNVTQTDTQTIRLEWSADYPEYVLESTPVLPSPIWSPVTNAVVSSGGVFMCDVAMNSSAKFFRLRLDSAP